MIRLPVARCTFLFAIAALCFASSSSQAAETVRLASDFVAPAETPPVESPDFWISSARDISYGGEISYGSESSYVGKSSYGTGCDNTGCGEPSCNDGCGSLTFRVGALFMKRESPDDLPLVIDNNGTVLSGGDFNFDYEMGADVSAIWDRPCFWAPVEFRYMWMNEWNDSRSSGALVNPRVNTVPPLSVNSPMNYANYESKLQTFELQFRKQLCNTTLLLGFRYASLDEDLDMLFGGGDQFWLATENDLYGFQVGLEKVLYDNCCKFRLEGFLKAGIYGNDANVSASVLAAQTEMNVSERSGMDHVSFLGELGLIAEYDLSCCWTLRAGYQAMWIDGILSAANQVTVANSNTAMPTAFDYTTALYHGGLLQLERRF